VYYRSFALFGIFLFVGMLLSVQFSGSVLQLDLYISQHVSSLRIESWNKWVIALTNLNGMRESLLFSALLLSFLLYKKWYNDARFYLLVLAGSIVLFSTVKSMVKRVRPQMQLIDISGYSFPSGHSTMSMAMAMALYFIFVRKIEAAAGRVVLLAMSLLWPLMIGASRIYLNVHWFSDVIGGLGLGLFWVMLLKLCCHRQEKLLPATGS